MTQYKISTLDLPSIQRYGIGFDQMFEELNRTFANSAQPQGYPPYNVVRHDDDNYEIQIAVAGFDKDEITVEVDQNQLNIKGKRADEDEAEITYLHRGLAARDFTRSFTLAEHIEVGEGRIKNGVLKVGLKRVIPESLKPRVLAITAE
jgi:molecular chaperone IbpA